MVSAPQSANSTWHYFIFKTLQFKIDEIYKIIAQDQIYVLKISVGVHSLESLVTDEHDFWLLFL